MPLSIITRIATIMTTSTTTTIMMMVEVAIVATVAASVKDTLWHEDCKSRMMHPMYLFQQYT